MGCGRATAAIGCAAHPRSTLAPIFTQRKSQVVSPATMAAIHIIAINRGVKEDATIVVKRRCGAALARQGSGCSCTASGSTLTRGTVVTAVETSGEPSSRVVVEAVVSSSGARAGSGGTRCGAAGGGGSGGADARPG